MTLVELLVVLGIIGLVVGISVPALTGFTKQVRLKTAIRQVAGLVSLARSTAISSHEDQAVVINPERREISVVGVTSGDALEQAVRLPSSVTVQVMVGGQPATHTQFVFRSSGSLNGRSVTLVLADHERQHTITINGTTGSVSVQ